MIMMWVLFDFMIMLILAVGSCTECKKVDVIEGGKVSLPFATSGLTFFYEIHCEEWTKTKIGQYCGPDDNCSTKSTTGVSIETGHLIVYNVTYNRCYSAIPEKNTPGNETCYNVTVSEQQFEFELRDVVSVVATFVVVVAASAAAVVVILVTIVLLADQYKCKQRNESVNANIAAQGSHEEINIGTPEAANSLLTTNSTLDGCTPPMDSK